eukprot:1157900-Pelagomonas_calceolata.AAC.10
MKKTTKKHSRSLKADRVLDHCHFCAPHAQKPELLEEHTHDMPAVRPLLASKSGNLSLMHVAFSLA